jgi:hypothetical protein
MSLKPIHILYAISQNPNSSETKTSMGQGRIEMFLFIALKKIVQFNVRLHITYMRNF